MREGANEFMDLWPTFEARDEKGVAVLNKKMSSGQYDTRTDSISASNITIYYCPMTPGRPVGIVRIFRTVCSRRARALINFTELYGFQK